MKLLLLKSFLCYKRLLLLVYELVWIDKVKSMVGVFFYCNGWIYNIDLVIQFATTSYSVGHRRLIKKEEVAAFSDVQSNINVETRKKLALAIYLFSNVGKLSMLYQEKSWHILFKKSC